MTQSRIGQSIFPDYPRDPKIVNEKGELTPYWDLGLSALFQALQENYKNEGVLFPALDATNINDIETFYQNYVIPAAPIPLPQNVPDISGQTVFDTTNRISKQFIIVYDTSNPPKVISAKWYNLNIMLLNNGVPPVTLIGTLYSFCYDTAGEVLYICTAITFNIGLNRWEATWKPI